MEHAKDIRKHDPLDLPYDLYQRYHLTAQIVQKLDSALGAGAPILEVGGDPGILQAFLPEQSPVIVNQSAQTNGSVIPADACHLPFKDRSFRGVVMLDVLEHVPEDNRSALLREIDRVSSRWLVVGGPFRDDSVPEAEAILVDFHRHLTGTAHRYLEEHRNIGLPDRTGTLEVLRSFGYDAVEIPNGLLWRWMLMLGINFFLQKDPADAELVRQVNHFVNLHLAPYDNRQPAYRHVILALRQPMPEGLRQQLRALESTDSGIPDDAVSSWEGATAALQALMARKIRQRDDRIRELEGQVKILEEFRDQVQRSLAYRMYRSWKGLWKRG